MEPLLEAMLCPLIKEKQLIAKAEIRQLREIVLHSDSLRERKLLFRVWVTRVVFRNGFDQAFIGNGLVEVFLFAYRFLDRSASPIQFFLHAKVIEILNEAQITF